MFLWILVGPDWLICFPPNKKGLTSSLSVTSAKQAEFNGNNLKRPLYFLMLPKFVTSRSWADLTVSSVCMAAYKIFWGLYWQTKFKYKAALPSESFSRAVLHLAAQLLLTHAKFCFLTIIIVTRVAGECASGVHDDWTTIDRDSIVLIPIKVIIMRIVAFTSITSLSSRDVWRRNVIVNQLFTKMFSCNGNQISCTYTRYEHIIANFLDDSGNLMSGYYILTLHINIFR